MTYVGDETMTVKMFRHDKGYGFFEKNGMQDVFVHISVVQDAGLEDIMPGQNFLVRVGSSHRGLVAMEIMSG